MEHLTSQALLAVADGVARPVTLDTLRQRGYLPASATYAGLSLTPDGRAVSDLYGTLAHPMPLSAAPIFTPEPVLVFSLNWQPPRPPARNSYRPCMLPPWRRNCKPPCREPRASFRSPMRWFCRQTRR